MVKGWKVFDLNKSETLSLCFGKELSSIFLNQNKNILLNIYIFYFFVNTREYAWISVDIKKLCGYSHNIYPTDINTSTRRIYIYLAGRVRENYTYPIHRVELPKPVH